MNVIFDEVAHTYTLGGVRLPSVTEVIRPLYDFSKVDPEVLRRAGAFGTAVHKAIELYLKDDLDEDDLDDNLRVTLDAFKMWQYDFPDFSTPDDIEQPGYHPKLLYAGTPDLEYESAVVDIKSRPVNWLTDPIQLAGYDHFGSGCRERYVLELRRDGTYEFTRVNGSRVSNSEAWARFRFLLEHHTNGQIIKSWGIR